MSPATKSTTRADAAANAEAGIFKMFRSYGVRAGEMVFFNRNGKDHPTSFRHAMQSMIDRGLVVKEPRHSDAYCLSPRGYEAMRAVD